jgi:uncharacterized protein (DUF1919 family)
MGDTLEYTTNYLDPFGISPKGNGGCNQINHNHGYSGYVLREDWEKKLYRGKLLNLLIFPPKKVVMIVCNKLK